MRQYQYRSQWHQSLWQSTVFVQRLPHLPRSLAQKRRLQRRATGRTSRPISRAEQYAWGRTGNRCLSAYIGSMDKKKVALSPTIEETLLPAEPDDVLELDEVWSFVQKRANKRWLWTAICRRTRQIVAAVIGDRSAKTCQQLWEVIPESYRRCHSYSDFWEAYSLVFDEETHRSVGKETGETAHMERWNNTLRQRVGRYVRKTLSFSKRDFWHQIVTEMFIITYNLSCIT